MAKKYFARWQTLGQQIVGFSNITEYHWISLSRSAKSVKIWPNYKGGITQRRLYHIEWKKIWVKNWIGWWLTFGNAFPANKMILSNRRKSRASSCLCRRNISQLKACNVMLSQSPIVWNCSQLVIWNLLRRCGPDNVLSGPAIQFFFSPALSFVLLFTANCLENIFFMSTSSDVLIGQSRLYQK